MSYCHSLHDSGSGSVLVLLWPHSNTKNGTFFGEMLTLKLSMMHRVSAITRTSALCAFMIYQLESLYLKL